MIQWLCLERELLFERIFFGKRSTDGGASRTSSQYFLCERCKADRSLLPLASAAGRAQTPQSTHSWSQGSSFHFAAHTGSSFPSVEQNIADEKLSIMWKWNVSDYFTERKIDKHFMNQLVICQHNVNINKTDSKEANSPSLDTNSNSVEGRNTNA